MTECKRCGELLMKNENLAYDIHRVSHHSQRCKERENTPERWLERVGEAYLEKAMEYVRQLAENSAMYGTSAARITPDGKVEVCSPEEALAALDSPKPPEDEL